MKIAFNPSTVAALIAPPNNKDITFDLRGHNIFARGVKFCGTDTNTWRDIKINNVSIDSNTLDLRDGDNTTLTNINGIVTINSTWRPVVDNLTSDSTTSSLSANLGRILKALIDGKSNSGHTHDDRYLKLTGGTMTGNIILSRNATITKLLASTSHYSSVVSWSVDGETKKYGREIGLHNLGGSDSTGSIAIVPYKTDTEPWSGTVGLFIAKNTLKLDGKPIAFKSDIPSSLKSPYSLTLKANGTTLAIYDGSSNKEANFTYANIGAASASHTHSNYVTDLGTSGNYLTWVKNGSTNNITVPYAKTSSYLTSGFSAAYTNKWDCNAPDRVVYSDYGSSGRSITNAPSGWHYGTLLELGHTNYNGLNGELNILLMWDVAHDTTLPGTLWFRGKDAINGWAKNWAKVITDLNISSILSNYYWANVKISTSSNAATSPTVALLKATTGVQIGNTADYGWYLYNNRICAGISVARDINTGSLLVSSAWADSSKVPTNGIYSKGNILTAGGFIKSGSSDSYVLLGGGGHKVLSDFVSFYGDISTADDYSPTGLKIIGVSGGSNTMGNGWGSILQMCNNAARSYKPNVDNGSANWYTQIMGNTDDKIRYRTSTNGSGWTSWKTLLSTADLRNINVASATKLQTSRTIWGQSFDGTSNVDGTLTISDSGSDDPHIISTVTRWFHIVSKYKLVLYAGDYNSSQLDAINILSNHNVGIGVDPSYKLHVAGDIYSSATIRTAAQNQAIVLSNNSNPAWISALEGQVIFNTGKAIRFGETSWDWNQWAGLKYTHSNKTIYLGIADNSIFNANSALSGGTLKLPGITTITTNPGARIGNSGGDLYLGNANNSAWLKVQDICSHNGSDYWYIYQNGNATFNYIKSKTNAYIVGNLEAGQIIRGGSGLMWVNGRNGALLRETSVSGYHTLWSLKTTDGSWDFGEYNAGSYWDNVPVLSYITDSNYNSGNNTPTYQIRFPLASGTVALTSDIPNPTNYYWANVKVSASSSTTTSPTVSNLTATSSIKMGNIYLLNTDEINNITNGGIYLNYRNSGNVSLCQGGGKVGISTATPSHELDVMGNTFTTGFGIRPYYLSNSGLLPTISPGDGYTYRCLEIGRSAVVSCIIADRVALSNKRGVLIKFNTGFDGLIVLLKDLLNYGDINGNGYFWVMPSGCKIIRPDSSSILINLNLISNAYDDGKSRFFVYSYKYDAWIEFYCG